ncbi:MAG: hypothetical protein KHW88_08685 [Lachnospiraceae bacterium]|nr:hypothetical protein [Lachnospiraceae bacterium]MEE0512790.1 hypothetical protein [Lachnospiraceae bacterium]
MTKTNRIRASFILGAAILTGAGYLWNASLETAPEKKQEKSKSKQEEMKETASSETPYEYVIVNDNGYLTVYQKDLKTVYFQTDIPYAELHTELQKKIDQGYLIQDAEELYDFLENYSS